MYIYTRKAGTDTSRIHVKKQKKKRFPYSYKYTFFCIFIEDAVFSPLTHISKHDTVSSMKTTLIKDILVSEPDGRDVTVYGWVRTKRETKNLIFIQVNDGSCFA